MKLHAQIEAVATTIFVLATFLACLEGYIRFDLRWWKGVLIFAASLVIAASTNAVHNPDGSHKTKEQIKGLE